MTDTQEDRQRRHEYYKQYFGSDVASRAVINKRQPKPIEDDYETLTEASQHTLDNYKGPSE